MVGKEGDDGSLGWSVAQQQDAAASEGGGASPAASQGRASDAGISISATASPVRLNMPATGGSEPVLSI